MDLETLGSGLWLVIVIAGFAAAAVLFVLGVVSVLRSARLTTAGRALWIAGMLVFPLLGPIAWFLLGRRGAPTAHRPGSTTPFS